MHIRVGVAGHSGYSGAEAVQLLTRNPKIQTILLDHRDLSESSGSLERLSFSAEKVRSSGLDAVLLATSPEVSMEAVPWLLESGVRVVDLSGAFRLGTAERYQKWYRAEHTAPELLARAVYGLPEFCRREIAGARFVSNPGCYPTAANLAIRPLVEANLIDRAAGIVCDAKSGVSGAGRKASLTTSFCEVTGNFSAYSVLHHRHVPEVLTVSGLEEREFSFTAQLIPVDRGILETIYVRGSAKNLERIEQVYCDRYAAEPFVKLWPAGTVPDIRAVVRTNHCAIGWVIDAAHERAVIVSAIDNLVKGAAGQAIQNLNLMLGMPETEGLL